MWVSVSARVTAGMTVNESVSICCECKGQSEAWGQDKCQREGRGDDEVQDMAQPNPFEAWLSISRSRSLCCFPWKSGVVQGETFREGAI